MVFEESWLEKNMLVQKGRQESVGASKRRRSSFCSEREERERERAPRYIDRISVVLGRERERQADQASESDRRRN